MPLPKQAAARRPMSVYTLHNTITSLRKPLRQRHVGRHQTIGLINNTMKLHVQNTIWLVSLQSSAKQQREMSIFQVLWRTWLCDAKFSLENSEVNNNGETPTILWIGRFIGMKLFLRATNEKVLKEIHFSSQTVLDVAVVFTYPPPWGA